MRGTTLYITPKAQYLHIPKTGGTWVQRRMREAKVPCLNPEFDISGHDPDPLEDKLVFTVVRNPHTWIRSVYLWMSDGSVGRSSWNILPGPCGELGKLGSTRDVPSYKSFVSRLVNDLPGAVGRCYDAYTRHCDFVGKTEELVESLLVALARSGEEFEQQAIWDGLEPLNVSAGHTEPLESELEAAIRETEKQAFVRYGYR